MKIIITKEQQESLQRKLKKMVKKLGWEKTSIVVNGLENLAKLAFNNDPLEFLNMFNNLDIVQSKNYQDWTLFRYEEGNNMMIYDRKNNYVFINSYEISSFLQKGFGLNYDEIRQITQEWLDKVHNLSGIITRSVGITRYWRVK